MLAIPGRSGKEDVFVITAVRKAEAVLDGTVSCVKTGSNSSVEI